MRKYIDCREFPSDMKCSIVIAADNDGELLEAAVQHAVAVHAGLAQSGQDRNSQRHAARLTDSAARSRESR